jgi:ferredoxin-nitrite reductase
MILRCTGWRVTVLTSALSSVSSLVAEPVSCPGLFCPTIAQDGILTRIRTPGGRVSRSQLHTLARVADRIGCTEVLITNRANLQLRSPVAVDSIGLQALQTVGLAAAPEIDHLRNIMASPLAGLDSTAIANVLPIVADLDAYISQATHLAPLSAKFSIGLDGGESVSVRDRLNDIWLVAESANSFRLYLGTTHTEIVTQDCVALVDSIAQVYLQHIDRVSVSVNHRRSQKARLRDVIQAMGLDRFVEEVDPPKSPLGRGTLRMGEAAIYSSNPITPVPVPVPPFTRGARGDRDLEITLPLGYLQTSQIRSLSHILQQFNLTEIRSTPWQTIFIPNVLTTDREAFKNALIAIDINPSPTHPARGIVACSGRSGCQSAATHAKEHALALIQQLTGVDRSFPSIHISGCEKRCAQPKDGVVTLIGIEIDGRECYELRWGDRSDISILHVEEALNMVCKTVCQTVCSPIPSPVLAHA